MFSAMALAVAAFQINSYSARRQATGQLTVTAIVQSSSTAVFEPDGTVKIIIANAPADEAALIAAASQSTATTQTPRPKSSGRSVRTSRHKRLHAHSVQQK